VQRDYFYKGKSKFLECIRHARLQAVEGEPIDPDVWETRLRRPQFTYDGWINFHHSDFDGSRVSVKNEVHYIERLEKDIKKSPKYVWA
jgi:hypothetical protein